MSLSQTIVESSSGLLSMLICYDRKMESSPLSLRFHLNSESISYRLLSLHISVADLRGRQERTPSPVGPYSFIFMQFSSTKIG